MPSGPGRLVKHFLEQQEQQVRLAIHLVHLVQQYAVYELQKYLMTHLQLPSQPSPACDWRRAMPPVLGLNVNKLGRELEAHDDEELEVRSV